jgi:tetratricopeptide (TPR) repeat protein
LTIDTNRDAPTDLVSRRGLAQDPPAAVRPGLVASVVLVTTMAVHATSIEAPFVWDDRPLILDSPLVQSARPLSEYFLRPFWMSPLDPDAARALYRPLVTLSYRLDHLIAGDAPLAFHATNVLLHTLVAALLFAWMRRLGAGLFAAALGTLAFSLHPRTTESVTWISGRTDVLALFFVLAALLLWPDRASPPDRRTLLRAVLAATLVFFGLLAKEVAVVGVLALAMTALMRTRAESGGSARDLPWRAPAIALRLIPLAVVVVAYVALRHHALYGQEAASANPPSRLWTALASLGMYATMIVDPRPSAQIGLATHPATWAIAVGAIATGASAWALLRAARRGSPWLVPLAMALAAIALVLHVVPLPVSVLTADRFLYVPLAGLATAGALASARASGRERWMRALGVGASLVVALFAWRTVERIDDWKDELRFWIVTGRDAERDNPLPRMELAGVLYRDKRFADALPLYSAVAGASGRGDIGSTDSLTRRALSNTASCLSLVGDYDQATAIRAALTRAQPESPRRHFDEGLVLLHARRFELAGDAFTRALELAPAYDDARTMLAITKDAATVWPSLPQGDAGASTRAHWLVRIGARPLAEEELRAVLRLPELPRDVVVEAATFLVEQGDIGLARLAVARARTDGVAEASALATRLEEREAIERKVDAALPEIRAIAARAAR